MLVPIDFHAHQLPGYSASFSITENEYRKNMQQLAAHKDNLRMVSDILLHAPGLTDYSQIPGPPLKQLVSAAVNILSQHCITQKETAAPAYLKEGYRHFQQGDYSSALNSWEKVLEIEPSHQEIFSFLLQIGEKQPAQAPSARLLAERYRFEYLNTFGKGHLCQPVAALLSSSGNTLFISDYAANKVCCFDMSGKYQGQLPLELSGPIGLFKDDKGWIWICDSRKSRLIAVDEQGAVQEIIELDKLLAGLASQARPVFGCWNHNTLYLILENDSRTSMKLVRVDPAKPGATFREMDAKLLPWPMDVKCRHGKVFVANFSPPMLFEITEDWKLRELAGLDIPHNIRRYTKGHDAFYLTAGKYVVKTSPEGLPIFTTSLAKFTNDLGVNAVGIELHELNGNQSLFITDNMQGAVHKFAV
jgi:tetratricopeptide (TPR) repeat protein